MSDISFANEWRSRIYSGVILIYDVLADLSEDQMK